MGRSRGGLTTKIHALVDANGNPIALKLTEGQAHDGRSAADMLDGIGAGQVLLADRAYDSDALRQRLAERGAWANVKPMPNRINIPAFSPFLYRRRNLVERFFNKIEHFRAVATRFESEFVARQRDRDRAAFLRARERSQLPADADIDLAIDQLVGPVYYRVLVTRQPVPPEFTDALVASWLARAAAQPGQDRQRA